MGTSHRIGPHTLVVEEDIAHLSLFGDLDLAQMEALVEILGGIEQRYGRIGVLADVRGLRSVLPEARQRGGAFTKSHFIFATAVYGASPTVRTVIMLISRATELFAGRRSNVGFFKTEAEALAWLQRQPRERRAVK